MFARKETLAAKGSNQEVYKKLCDITKGVMGLIKKGGVDKSSLHEALYGQGGREPFVSDGETFIVDGCGFGFYGRSQYCSHLGPNSEPTNGHGCFGDSLLGTFLCLCTKGNNHHQDLCGLDNLNGIGSWIGSPSSSNSVLKRVWEEIRNNCFNNNTTVHMEELENAVNEIKNNTKHNNLNGNGRTGYYIGSSTNIHGPCSGVNSGDACVTYPPKSATVNEPNIPWAEKILSAVEKLNKARDQQQANHKNAATIGLQGNHDDPTDPGTDEDNEHEEEETEESEESAPNPGPHNNSKPPRSRRKRRSTNNQRTEQHPEPRKVILHKDDGTFLPQPFWLLSAVVF